MYPRKWSWVNGCVLFWKDWKSKVCVPYYRYKGRISIGSCLSSERADFIMTHLLEVIDIIVNLVQIKTENALAYATNKMKLFCISWHKTYHSYTLQSYRAKSYTNIKSHFKFTLDIQNGVINTPIDRLHNTLLIFKLKLYWEGNNSFRESF